MVIQALSSALLYPNRGLDPVSPKRSLEPFKRYSQCSLESLNLYYQSSLNSLNPYNQSSLESLNRFCQCSFESLNLYYQSSIMPILTPRASFPPSNGGIYRVFMPPWIRSGWRPAPAARNGGLRWI